MAFVLAYSMAPLLLVWEEWPSRISNIGWSSVDNGRLKVLQPRNVSLSIHPEVFVITLPNVAQSFSASLRCFLLDNTISGTQLASALVQQQIVFMIPSSTLVETPTCLFSLAKITFPRFWTIVIPDSSISKLLMPSKLCLSMVCSRSAKKCLYWIPCSCQWCCPWLPEWEFSVTSHEIVVLMFPGCSNVTLEHMF